MKERELLRKMFAETLSLNDKKEICRCREFGHSALESYDLLEELYFSKQGVRESLSTLSEIEQAFLHYISFGNRSVPISVFVRIFPNDSSPYGSFTEKFKGVYRSALEKFVRKGLLLVGVTPNHFQKSSKLERTLFLVPSCVTPLLPQLITGTPVNSELQTYLFQSDLLNLISNSESPPKKVDPENPLRLENGELKIGKNDFEIQLLQSLRLDLWARKLWKNGASVPLDRDLSRKTALEYLYSSFPKEDRVLPSQIEPLIKIFFGTERHDEPNIDAKKLCQNGVDLGLLSPNFSRCNENRPCEPASYLSIYDGQSIRLELASIPIRTLSEVAQISTFSISNDDFLAQPSAQKLSRLVSQGKFDQVSGAPWIEWLKQNSQAYQRTFEAILSKRGKTVLHQNLMVARVKDLSLRVKLEKTFSEPRQLLVFQDQYIAFPPGLLPAIEKIVKKEGHVIKLETYR